MLHDRRGDVYNWYVATVLFLRVRQYLAMPQTDIRDIALYETLGSALQNSGDELRKLSQPSLRMLTPSGPGPRFYE